MFVTNSVCIDNRVVKEAASLAQAGHDVTVFGMRVSGEAEDEPFEGFRIRRVARDRLRGEAGRSGDAAPRGVLAMSWSLADYWWRARRAALGATCEVCHAHDLPTLPVAWAVARRRGAALVYDAHELFTEMGRLPVAVRGAWRGVESALIRRADRVVTVNGSIADELGRRYGIRRPDVVRNLPRRPAALPAREASPLRNHAGLPADVPIVLYQGLYMPHRGLENLVRAAAGFERDARLVMLGWGPMRAELETLARSEGVAARVAFAEPVPMAELLAHTAGADVGVVPYLNVGLNNFYTSPNKLFEYLASGVPVAASAFPELRAVIEARGLGATFDPEQPASMAAAVNGLIGDAAATGTVRRRVAEAAPEFAWDREAQKLLAVYASLGSAA